MTGPTVAVVEIDGTGHRAWYVRLILDELARSRPGQRVLVITTADAMRSDAWKLHLGDLDHQVELVNPGADVMVDAAAVAVQADAFMIVPDGERLTRAAGRVPTNLHGAVLLLRSHPQPGWRGSGRFLAKCFLVRRLRRRAPGVEVFSLESTKPTQHSLMRRAGARVALDPVVFEPSSDAGREWLTAQGVPASGSVVLVIGDLSARKHVSEILRAWEATERAPVLALVGNPSDEVRAQAEDAVRSGRDGLVVRFGILSDEDFDTWIASVDAVFTLHTNPGPSGVLLKAWAAGTTAVVDDERLVREVCKQLQVDALVVEPQIALISAALEQIRARDGGSAPRSVVERAGTDVPRALVASVPTGGSA